MREFCGKRVFKGEGGRWVFQIRAFGRELLVPSDVELIHRDGGWWLFRRTKSSTAQWTALVLYRDGRARKHVYNLGIGRDGVMARSKDLKLLIDSKRTMESWVVNACAGIKGRAPDPSDPVEVKVPKPKRKPLPRKKAELSPVVRDIVEHEIYWAVKDAEVSPSPLTIKPQCNGDDRYLPRHLYGTYATRDVAVEIAKDMLRRGVLEYFTVSRHTRLKGLRVVEHVLISNGLVNGVHNQIVHNA